MDQRLGLQSRIAHAHNVQHPAHTHTRTHTSGVSDVVDKAVGDVDDEDDDEDEEDEADEDEANEEREAEEREEDEEGAATAEGRRRKLVIFSNTCRVCGASQRAHHRQTQNQGERGRDEGRTAREQDVWEERIRAMTNKQP